MSLAVRATTCIFTNQQIITLKRFWKILRNVVLSLLLLIVALWIAIQLPFVQNWLADYAAKRLSKALQTKVQVKNVSFTLLNKVNLEGLYIEDQQQDTLLSAGKMQLNLNDWFILKDSIDLKYMGLQDTRIYLQRSRDTIWNYQFIIDYFSGNKKKKPADPSDTTKQKLTLNVNAIDMSNVIFEMRDKWKGNTQYIGVGALNMTARSVDPSTHLFDIAELKLTSPRYMALSYHGNWSYEDSVRERRRIDALPPGGGFPKNNGNIDLRIAKVTLEDGFFQLRNLREVTALQDLFDTKNIFLDKIDGTATNLRWKQDTLSFTTDLKGGSGNSFQLKKLHTDYTFQPQLMEFKNLDLQLSNSRITDYFSMAFKNTDEFSDFINKVKLKADFKNTTVSTNDLAYFASGMKGKNQVLGLNGLVAGTLNDLQSDKILLTAGHTRIAGALLVQNTTDADHLFIDFKTNGSSFYLPDLLPWAPALKSLPMSIQKALQPLQFKGYFTGLIKDFKVNGNLTTPQGSLTANAKLNLNKETYDGQVTTDNLNLGGLFDVPNLSRITFDGNIKGQGFNKQANVVFTGNMRQATYNGYTYQNISAQGEIKEMLLKSSLKMADPNLQGDIDVAVNLRQKNQAYIGNGTLTTANFRTLNLTKQNIRFSGEFDVNFTGKNIDDFLGYARLKNARLYDGENPFSFDSLLVTSIINPEGKKELGLQTNDIDASVAGTFNIAGLPNSFQYFLSSYYPAIIPKPKTVAKNQDFTFAVSVKNIEPYLQLFDPKLEGLNYSSITGIINTTDNQLVLNATVPYFKYGQVQISNASLQATGDQSKLNVFGTLDEFRMSDSLSFPNATINVATANEVSNIQINTSRGGLFDEASINADLTMQENSLQLRFSPSSFILNNKKWTIEQGGELLRINKQLMANNLTLRQEDQSITINSVAPEEGSNNEVQIRTRNLNIGDLLPYVLKQPKIEGLLSGDFLVINPLGKPTIQIDSLRIDQARMNGDSIGQLNAKGNVDLTTGIVKAKVSSPNEGYRFDADINANLYDSTGNQLSIDINLQRERLNILQGYLNTIFDEFDGYATGRLQIKGKASSPQLIGDITITNAKLKVQYTQVTYFIDSALIHLQPDGMDFGTMRIKDRFNNYGTVQGGFKHNFFQNMVFDLSVKSDKLELINTGLRNNPTFYGNAVGRGSYELKGPSTNLTMNISAEPTDTSHIFIPNSSSSRQSSATDFIVFKQYGREQVATDAAASNLHINVDLKVDNRTQIDVILDYANNDVISAWGKGKLAIVYSNDAFTMKGRYDVERGLYNYNFQSFIRKPFNLAGDGTNYIEWVSGDPLDANLHVNATYTATNVRFSDLNANSNITLGNNSIRGDVQVTATISGKLLKPDIDFKIDLPQGSTLANEPSAQLALERINKDASERLKQVTYLIVFNQFAPYGGATGIRNPGADLAANTISEVISRYLGSIISNVLYQITGDRSLQVDFSTSVYNSADIGAGNISASSYDRQRVNFKVGKSLANNRILVNVGSDFDFSYTTSAVNGFQFLPDISVEFILSNDRKLRAILFKRDNLELGSRRNRVGASISFRQDFDRFFRHGQDTISAAKLLDERKRRNDSLNKSASIPVTDGR